MGVPVVGLQPQHLRAVDASGSIDNETRSSPGSDEKTVGGHRRRSYSEPDWRSRDGLRSRRCGTCIRMSLGFRPDTSNDHNTDVFPSVDAHVADV
jgi:hypothetical protein